MADLLLRLGGRLYRADTSELVEVADVDIAERASRPPFLVRLGFAAWCDDARTLTNDPVAFDGAELDAAAAPPSTAEMQALLKLLVVVRHRGALRLLDGIDATRHLVQINDSASRQLNARSVQSPFLVGLSFAAAVPDQDVLRNPTDASMAEL
ncbi:MAG: hypothetical protein AAFX81_12135 [Pseudomonadota bacterium]